MTSFVYSKFEQEWWLATFQLAGRFWGETAWTARDILTELDILLD